MQLRTILIGILGLAAAVITGCGSDNGSGKPAVIATTGILADITGRVAGPDVEVKQLIPDATSPHEFQVSAEDRRDLEEAALVTANGAELEHGVPLDDVDSPTWELVEHAGKLRPFGADEQAEEPEEDEEPHGAFDPHVWMDPVRVRAALPSLAEALAEAYPENGVGFQNRARALARRLEGVDEELRRAVETIPKGDRKLVTSHDALGYFADRYGFEVVATPFPPSGPEAEPGAGRIRDVEETIRSTGVPTVFAEETDDPKVLSRIADDTDVRIDDALLVEAPGRAGSYLEMLLEDARLLRQGLGTSR
jgi:ABC-type Zn uptake system ZnuABC Zn-binding protein ZnuA